MRKQHNVKSTPSFTRAFVELELGLPLTVAMAYVNGHIIEQVNVVHAWTRSSILSDMDASLALMDIIKAEHDAVVPVLHKMRREPCFSFSLPEPSEFSIS